MTDETPVAPTTPPPPSARVKTKIGDVIFGWKSAVVIFIGGLILGGLGGAGIGSMGHHHHHPRGERMMQMRDGGPRGYVNGGGFQGGGGYGAPGGGMIIPPGMPAVPNTSKAPTPQASPKANG